MKFATRAIHAGYERDPATHAVMPPVYQTSIFSYDRLGDEQPYSYSRSANPTRAALEANVAALEGMQYGLAFGSGMAAIDAVLRATLVAGDEVIALADCYGGAYRLLTRIYAPAGVTVTFLDLTSRPEQLEDAIGERTRLVWLESPTNPLLKLVDLPRVAAICRARGVTTAIDNTFASPYLQNPRDSGIDIVMHSATKYLAGHSDVILGVVCTDNEQLAARLKLVQNSAGAVPGPQDCFLALRGIKTLALRMQRHCDNAMAVAGFLATHPAIDKVIYPGLPTHPQHELASRQMRGFGGVVTIYLKDDSRAAAARVAERLQWFALGESLGGVESIVNHSATMSHGSMPAGVKQALGIREGMLRLSVGIEDVDDLLADLAQALA
ncbi:PLP-dependent aspartate aminotransferase family protein [Laribacter hongkongensis]|uniref:PLP-dependent aspartate aminotransferase family protein n=1 Tax=Laribacter hongkongensis TaxID=168471 RepID=A0ABD4SPL3_9NEIS|nr:PLP-dependent aspartate aminotransferase family protein [Laribacter hongkongensis]MCG9024554.1 PLP-dependent aspartate aminotransferase family protein [Laribacter hongkongensis]MCG9099588.1 PLP-dependent aspartate aminotransferase family protein [Laribacter hongkongensis]MCG9103958.1 PLP-dependent aspartate aminotransferase family protein [Laribacter hongkongensis]MCG9111629.1 PLP-dependent aspartate aminotransferase family protein [Laribacter hongkongensis]MCG9117121.1 PLP-dependent aspart